MKKIFSILAVLVALVSCQVIKPEDRYIEVPTEEEGERNVLLMDFTGWKCVNCPEAAKVANGLIDLYGSHVIVVSMHPEGISFTEPGASGPDFATEEAKDYLDAFGGSNSLPVGVIDGQKVDNSYLVEYQQWPAVVTERVKVNVDYSMEMTASTSSCSVTIMKKGADNRNVSVVLWLLEDSIIAPQLTNDGEEKEYAHRHVFRKCLNGTDIWGEAAEFEYGEASIDAVYQLPNLEGRNFVIVAVAFDADTHEVLQAEEVELKQKGEGSFDILFEGDTLQDGDTIDVTKVSYSSGEVEFDGSIVNNYAEKTEFTVVENRYFDFSVYTVTMCFKSCMSDNPENPGFWTCNVAGLQEQTFQAHVKIPQEEQGDTITLETDYSFSDGVKTKTIRVRFHYVPEEPEE